MGTQVSNFDYELPQERIAMYPLEERDASQLLVYREGKIKDTLFWDLGKHVPEGALFLYNDSKVVPVRLHFQKPTGAHIEVFVLEPAGEQTIENFYASQGPISVQCMVGNKKKWQEGSKLSIEQEGLKLEVYFEDRPSNILRFRWNKPISFAKVLDLLGHTPLPPYIKRVAESSDKERYQSIFAEKEGSVAAPTASLHFTDRLINQLKQDYSCSFEPVTLYVSAGTFKPISSEIAEEHDMHAEMMSIHRRTLEALRLALVQNRPIIPIGTTALRVIESMYWHLLHKPADEVVSIGQEMPYQQAQRKPALEVVEQALQEKVEAYAGATSLYIRPGYPYAFADALITNFHMPKSTLLLLVSAFIGEDWGRVYEHALEHQYRFLSYGDASLLWRKQK